VAGEAHVSKKTARANLFADVSLRNWLESAVFEIVKETPRLAEPRYVKSLVCSSEGIDRPDNGCRACLTTSFLSTGRKMRRAQLILMGASMHLEKPVTLTAPAVLFKILNVQVVALS
jgi:hypothetical protein